MCFLWKMKRPVTPEQTYYSCQDSRIRTVQGQNVSFKKSVWVTFTQHEVFQLQKLLTTLKALSLGFTLLFFYFFKPAFCVLFAAITVSLPLPDSQRRSICIFSARSPQLMWIVSPEQIAPCLPIILYFQAFDQIRNPETHASVWN